MKSNWQKKEAVCIAIKLAQRQAIHLMVAMRQKLLAMPVKVSPKLAAVQGDRFKCQQILQAEILSILEELRQLPESVQPGWLQVEEEKEK